MKPLGGYRTPAKAGVIQAGYRAAQRTIGQIVEHDLIVFEPNAQRRESALDARILKLAYKRAAQHPESIQKGYVFYYSDGKHALPVGRARKLVKKEEKTIRREIRENAAALEDALTSVGYGKETLEGHVIYMRENEGCIDVLADAKLHLPERPAGICLYRVPLDHKWNDPLADKQGWRRREKKHIVGLGMAGASAMYLGVAAINGSLPLTLIFGTFAVLSLIYAGYNMEGYRICKRKPAHTGNDALHEAIRPTVEHERIMNPHAEATKEQIRLQRIWDYMNTPITDLVRGKGPRVRINIGENEDDLVDMEIPHQMRRSR